MSWRPTPHARPLLQSGAKVHQALIPSKLLSLPDQVTNTQIIDLVY